MALRNLHNYLLLTLFSLLMFISGITLLPVIDRDEAHFAQASRQMLQTSNYFQIRFQEKTRFQKPPGINWLQAASVKLFSDANSSAIWPYRLPSLLGSLISILLTYFFARRVANEKTARLAAALVASTLLLVVETHMAVIDASLLASVMLMQIALWMIYRDGLEHKKTSLIWALCFWLALAFGLVLKGVTPLIGLLSILTLCLFEKDFSWLRGLRFFSGFSLFAVLSLAWVLLVNEAEHSNYLLQMIHKDLLPKLQGGHESHGKPPLFHLVILVVTFWPASLFLWQGFQYALNHRHEALIKFLIAWLVPTWLFFEIMPTKLPQYVLPTFPAIALLCALGICQFSNSAKPGKMMRFLHILWGLISIGLAAGLASLPFLLMNQWTLVASLLFVIITVLTIVAVNFAWRGAYQRASMVVLSMALLSYPLIFAGLLPQLKPLWLTSDIAKLVDKNKISSAKPLVVVNFDEPSLVFNLNTSTVQFTDFQTAFYQMQNDPSRLMLIDEKMFKNTLSENKNLSVLADLRGFDYSKGRWLTLLLVGCNACGEN